MSDNESSASGGDVADREVEKLSQELLRTTLTGLPTPQKKIISKCNK